MGRRLLESEIQEALRLGREGRSVRAIRKLVRLDRETIAKILRSAGVPVRNPRHHQLPDVRQPEAAPGQPAAELKPEAMNQTAQPQRRPRPLWGP